MSWRAESALAALYDYDNCRYYRAGRRRRTLASNDAVAQFTVYRLVINDDRTASSLLERA